VPNPIKGLVLHSSANAVTAETPGDSPQLFFHDDSLRVRWPIPQGKKPSDWVFEWSENLSEWLAIPTARARVTDFAQGASAIEFQILPRDRPCQFLRRRPTPDP
jgi:hypothetical protein